MKLSRIFGSLLLLIAFLPAQASVLPGPLVESDWLVANTDKVFILDVRKDVKSFTGKPMFTKDKKTGKKKLRNVGGHIPGASLVNYKKVRDKRMINGKEVTRIVPEKAAFEKLMQDAGVNKDSAIVVVTKGLGVGDMTMATRMYWTLKYFGHDNVAILNGGLAQWTVDGRRISSKAAKPARGNWVASAERREILATTEDVEKAVNDKGTQLVDNRSLSQYLGTYKKSYVYSKGHIPGAKVFPNELMMNSKVPSKFLSLDELKALSDQMGVKPDSKSITYCNSGHLASGGWFIMSELMGNKNVKLYDGSMHEWTMTKKPVKSMVME